MVFTHMGLIRVTIQHKNLEAIRTYLCKDHFNALIEDALIYLSLSLGPTTVELNHRSL
jgi:hypothetical protein